MASNETIANVVLRDLDLNFKHQTFQVTSKDWTKISIIITIGYEVLYLHSNCITANVVHHDHDLHFQGHEFINAKASKKC